MMFIWATCALGSLVDGKPQTCPCCVSLPRYLHRRKEEGSISMQVKDTTYVYRTKTSFFSSLTRQNTRKQSYPSRTHQNTNSNETNQHGSGHMKSVDE